jgi:hypothetical protein
MSAPTAQRTKAQTHAPRMTCAAHHPFAMSVTMEPDYDFCPYFFACAKFRQSGHTPLTSLDQLITRAQACS